MDHYNYLHKPFDMNVIYEQLNSCKFKPESVEDNSMDKLGMEVVPSLTSIEGSSQKIFQHSSIFKSLALEAALMTTAEERTKAINRVFHTMSHLVSRNIVINILMSLIHWTFENGDVVTWKLDKLGFTDVSKIVNFIRILLIMNVWTDREYNENEILPNKLEKNILELLSNIIIALAEHYRPAYNYAISMPVQVSLFCILYMHLKKLCCERWDFGSLMHYLCVFKATRNFQFFGGPPVANNR